MKEFPYISLDTLDDVIKVLEFIVKERKIDVGDFTNLKNIFISGRKVGKIPTGASDVNPDTDCVGDFNYNASFLYILVNNGGTAVWRRAALSTF